MRKIVLSIKTNVKGAQKASFTPAVIYGDCSTGGHLDVFLDEENVTPIPGPYCYQSFMGEADFDAAMDQKRGIFFLANTMV